jgi:hypothetical protein
VDLFNQIRKKLVIFVNFKGFNISQKPKSSPLSYFAQKTSYFHWYKILGLLYKRALFDLQFVHNLFCLKLKRNARSKLFYCIIYRSSIWSSRTLTKLKSQSQKCFNEWKYQYVSGKKKKIPRYYMYIYQYLAIFFLPETSACDINKAKYFI